MHRRKRRKSGNAHLIPNLAKRKTVARILVNLTDESVNDKKRLQDLYVLADKLRYYLNNNPKLPYMGLGTEIACWIGLLITTHEMGLAYRKNLIASFPNELGIFNNEK